MTTLLPSVIIDIGKGANGDGSAYYPPEESSGQQVRLEESEDPPNSSFWKFEHEALAGQPFMVREVKYNGMGVPNITPSGPIYDYSVWYWKHDEEMTNPLLIEVWKNGKYEYSSNKGNNSWTRYKDPQLQQLQGKRLEKKLESLNCQYHKLVTINLTDDVSKEYARSQKPYCCNKHERSGQGRVSVTSGKINVSGQTITAYKHELDPSFQLAGIKYNEGGVGGPRKNIKLKAFSFPIDGSISVYVFYCQKHDPLLIYVETTNPDAKGWYKRQKNSSGKDEEWKKLPELREITPGNLLQNTGCGKYTKLVRALKKVGCAVSATCSATSFVTVAYEQANRTSSQQEEQDSQRSEGTGSTGEDEEDEEDKEEYEADTDSQPSAPGPSGEPGEGAAGPSGPTGDSEDSGGGGRKESQEGESRPAESAPSESGRDGDIVQDSGEVDQSLPKTQGAEKGAEGAKAASSEGLPPPTPLEEPKPPARSVGAAPLGLMAIFKISSGVFGGSGAVGLAGYHLYKHTRDPWVRQI
ncbi:hypothetical protein BEWA_036650 [Theileria equi strain WA]|uniref:Uncharacterized protein n=1 Tax=Theileria equi strain WA TaxID=1537102 RepID=L1LEB5_THEEQ|nr:hypothetical protein BEWA_036650 [Theileria equi strain WA]EKX73629.1 hypothetical protein BEWA_036650 [Theileria equi strain WA]|eukprot:XP_004833081.1 hypothetical protein BEWA_036650 [Theileria equi strain WA]